MLLQRVITAVLLLALLLPALLIDNLWPFAALTLLMVGAGGWEWGRLAGLGQGGSLVLGAIVVLACLGAWQAGWASAAPSGVWWAALACWVVAGAWALKLGPSGWSTLPRGVRLVAGALVLTAAWLALVAAKQRGFGFILTSMCIVWAADIGAYFGG